MVAKPKKRPVEFLGSSLDDIRDFPETARIEAGSQIRRVQYGDEPEDWKPMPAIGAGVNEIRIRDGGDQCRVKPDLELAKKRLRELLEALQKCNGRDLMMFLMRSAIRPGKQKISSCALS